MTPTPDRIEKIKNVVGLYVDFNNGVKLEVLGKDGTEALLHKLNETIEVVNELHRRLEKYEK